MAGLGVDLHPYYQRGVTALPGVEYGWLKMADGAHVYRVQRDGRWWTADAHAALFRGLGIPFGGYVYAQPGDGAAEARVLWAECTRLGGIGVAPGCDIESNASIHIWSTREAIDHGRAFCSAMRGMGVRPAIYMNDSLAGATKPDTWPEDPVLWIARYGAKPHLTRYDVHQYSSSGSLPGSAGLVDENQAYTTAHLIGGQTHREDPDMLADERRALFQVVEQLTGSRDLDRYPGWDKLPVKDFTKATLVDFVRQLYAKVDAAAKPEIDYAKLAAALPPEMAEDIAERVATKLATRLAQ